MVIEIYSANSHPSKKSYYKLYYLYYENIITYIRNIFNRHIKYYKPTYNNNQKRIKKRFKINDKLHNTNNYKKYI